MAHLSYQKCLARWNIHQQRNTEVDVFQISQDTEDRKAESIYQKSVTNALVCILQLLKTVKPLKYVEIKNSGYRDN